MVIRFLALLILTFFAPPISHGEIKQISMQAIAMAPNAGGQEAYALKLSSSKDEWTVFSNSYLQTGGYPLSGGIYSLRLPICGMTCFWQFYTQFGVGLSNAGPLLELTWSTNLLWLARLDFSTQMFFLKDRVIMWSYPLWLGVSVPF